MLRELFFPEPGPAFVQGMARGQKLLQKWASPSRPGARPCPCIWLSSSGDQYLQRREDEPHHLARGQGPQGHLQLLLGGILQVGIKEELRIFTIPVQQGLYQLPLGVTKK